MDKTHNNTYYKDYYQKNKEKWNEYKKCEICGGRYSNNTRTNHLNSNKHIMQKNIITGMD